MTVPERWWVVSESELADALDRAQAGESASEILFELLACAELADVTDGVL